VEELRALGLGIRGWSGGTHAGDTFGILGSEADVVTRADFVSLCHIGCVSLMVLNVRLSASATQFAVVVIPPVRIYIPFGSFLIPSGGSAVEFGWLELGQPLDRLLRQRRIVYKLDSGAAIDWLFVLARRKGPARKVPDRLVCVLASLCCDRPEELCCHKCHSGDGRRYPVLLNPRDLGYCIYDFLSKIFAGLQLVGVSLLGSGGLLICYCSGDIVVGLYAVILDSDFEPFAASPERPTPGAEVKGPARVEDRVSPSADLQLPVDIFSDRWRISPFSPEVVSGAYKPRDIIKSCVYPVWPVRLMQKRDLLKRLKPDAEITVQGIPELVRPPFDGHRGGLLRPCRVVAESVGKSSGGNVNDYQPVLLEYPIQVTYGCDDDVVAEGQYGPAVWSGYGYSGVAVAKRDLLELHATEPQVPGKRPPPTERRGVGRDAHGCPAYLVRRGSGRTVTYPFRGNGNGQPRVAKLLITRVLLDVRPQPWTRPAGKPDRRSGQVGEGLAPDRADLLSDG
jgi:hypothetical protein